MGTHQPIRKTVLPEIPDKLYFRIGDVARLCEVPAYVLRFWETEFPQLKPNKGGTGQRLYRKRDVEMALRIKSLLYDQGYTIPGARQVFKSEARVKGVPSVSPIPSTLASEEFSASPRPIAERSSELRPVAPEGEAEATRQAKLRLLREQMQNLLDSLSAPLDSSSSVRPGRANLPSERPSASRLQALRPRLVSGSPSPVRPCSSPCPVPTSAPASPAAPPKAKTSRTCFRRLQHRSSRRVGTLGTIPPLESGEPELPVSATLPPPSPARRTHTVASATLLLMGSSVLSGVLALVRIKYVNFLFGAGLEQDAYRAAFKLPDLLNYFLIGGAASISLITILNRYREAGDEQGADRALSVILTTMLCVLGAGVVLAEVLAPEYVVWANKGFRADPHRAALCTALTRLMLPAQLFFFWGSVMSARLQVRKIFIYQAFQPLLYNGGIMAGAVLLHRQLGIFSLGVGVLAGVAIGSALLNTLGALRTGLHFRPAVGFRDPAFREWLRLSLPLMIGVSLVMFDGLFLNYFASLRVGGITLISNAKDLFNAPFNVIGSAAGAASLPFFASLFQQGRAFDFSASVARSVSRLAAVGMLVAAWMIALAPWLMDLFRGGKFGRADAAGTTHLFILLSLTLPLWAVQGLYARAFYAAGNTRTPAITGTIITVLSAPVYWFLYGAMDMRGLALASDLGITAQTVSLAVLLQRHRLVSLTHLEWPELARASIAAVSAWGVTAAVVALLPAVRTHTGDALLIAAGTAIWAAVTGGVLLATGSKLPSQILRRRSA